MWDRWVAEWIDPHCVLCGNRTRLALCEVCRAAAGRTESTPSGLIVRSVGPYGRSLSERIQRLKYQEETLLAHRLGAAMAEVLPPEWLHATLVPVPLHPERLAERGFNQSALLARKIGDQRKLRTDFDRLKRTKATRAQAQLSYRERVENAESAFSCKGGLCKAAYILVDDVVTTGHTVDACRASLEHAGARVLGALAAATGGGLTHLLQSGNPSASRSTPVVQP